MGHPRKARKKYDTPPHPWNATRIKEENELVEKYGLKNKKELWKAETMVKRYRRQARYLLGTPSEQTTKERLQLLDHFVRIGIFGKDAHLEDVLNLNVEDVLKRRLQTIVHERGLAKTPKQARLFVVHGHIALDGRKIDAPSYLVKKDEEDLVGFYPSSPMKKYQKEESEGKVKE